MNLAIVNLTAGGISGGYVKYLNYILPGLANNPSIKKILCLSPSDINSIYLREKCPAVEFHDIEPLKLFNFKSIREIEKIVDTFKPDVVFVPVERKFRYMKAPVICMLQNMEPFILPFEGNPLKERIKNIFRYLSGRAAVLEADRIIAISNYVKDFLHQKFSIDQNKVGLVYHGNHNSGLMMTKPSQIPENINEFLFTAGSIRPARGLEDILIALKYLKKENINISLIIAGTANKALIKYKKKLESWILNNGLYSSVIWAENLSANEMTWCYKNCTVFIMSSRVESFGMIAVEAMSNGCICISAKNACLPEIFDNAAEYYSPADGYELSQKIKQIMAVTEPTRKQYSEKAIKRSEYFSWDLCVKRTIEELNLAIKYFEKVTTP